MEPRANVPHAELPDAPVDVVALQTRANLLLWQIGARVWCASREEAYKTPLAIRRVGERTYEWYRQSVRFEDDEVNRRCAEIERLRQEIRRHMLRQMSRAVGSENDPG